MNREELNVTVFILAVFFIGYLMLEGYWVAIAVIGIFYLVRGYRQHKKEKEQAYQDWWKHYNEKNK